MRWRSGINGAMSASMAYNEINRKQSGISG